MLEVGALRVEDFKAKALDERRGTLRRYREARVGGRLQEGGRDKGR